MFDQKINTALLAGAYLVYMDQYDKTGLAGFSTTGVQISTRCMEEVAPIEAWELNKYRGGNTLAWEHKTTVHGVTFFTITDDPIEGTAANHAGHTKDSPCPFCHVDPEDELEHFAGVDAPNGYPYRPEDDPVNVDDPRTHPRDCACYYCSGQAGEDAAEAQAAIEAADEEAAAAAAVMAASETD